MVYIQIKYLINDALYNISKLFQVVIYLHKFIIASIINDLIYLFKINENLSILSIIMMKLLIIDVLYEYIFFK